MILDTIILYKLFNKEPRINYVPEIRNGCDVWEQAFRRYCVDLVVSSDADRWMGLHVDYCFPILSTL